MSDIVSFVVRLPGKPEHREQLLTKLQHVLETMSGEPDFINTTLHRASDDPDTLVVYETWACSADYFKAHHLAKPYRKDYEAALPSLLKAPRTIEWLDPLKEYLKR
jgi:quinol monooxygenase YgiN